MKQLMGVVMVLLASAAFAQDDLDKLLADLENGSMQAEEMVNTDEFRKILACTNGQSDVVEKIKSAIRAHKMAPMYEHVERLRQWVERITPERLAKLSPLAQKKYREKLSQCKIEIEKEEYKKTQYEFVWAHKKWPSMSAWKKRHDAEEMEKKRKQAEESLADTELRLVLMQAAKEAGTVYEERQPNHRWF